MIRCNISTLHGQGGRNRGRIQVRFLHDELSRLTYHFKQIEQNVTDALLKKYGKPIPEEEIVTDSLKISKLRTTRTEVDESIHYESVQEDGEAHLVTFTSLKHYPEWVEVNRKVKDVISKETADDL